MLDELSLRFWLLSLHSLSLTEMRTVNSTCAVSFLRFLQSVKSEFMHHLPSNLTDVYKFCMGGLNEILCGDFNFGPHILL
jgi:hypothetical protein